MMDGIFICAAAHCLKSFLKKTKFESHIHGPTLTFSGATWKEEGANDSKAASAKQSTTSKSTARAPPRQVFSPRDSQPTDAQPPTRPIIQPKSPPSQFFGQVQYLPETFADYPQCRGPHPRLPNFTMPVSSNSIVGPPPFGYALFAPEGDLPFYGGPYEMARPELAPEVGAEQGLLFGFSTGPAVGVTFSNGPRPWIMGPTGQGMVGGFQVRPVFFQGDYGQNMGVMAPNMAPPSSMNKVVEPGQGGSGVDPRDA